MLTSLFRSRVQASSTRHSFRPELMQLESRNLLSGGSIANLPTDLVHYVTDFAPAVKQIVQGEFIQAIGASEKLIGSTGAQDLQDLGSALVNAGSQTLSQDRQNISSDLDLVTNVLTANSQLPSNALPRYSNDVGFLLEGSFVTVFGAITGNSSIRNQGLQLANGAVNDFVTAINQQIQSVFNLSSFTNSLFTQIDNDNDNDADIQNGVVVDQT